MSERLFRVIVGGGYAGASEEGKEKFLFGAYEIASETEGHPMLLLSRGKTKKNHLL
jgi:hypothetical protein